MAPRFVEGFIGRFDELAQDLGEACELERLGGVGQHQKQPSTVGLVSLRGVPEPVVPVSYTHLTLPTIYSV